MANKEIRNQAPLTEEELQLNQKLDGFDQLGKKATEQFIEMGREAIRYAYGDQHAGRKKKKGWEYPVTNRMYADILQEVAFLSSNNPRVHGVPVSGSKAELATACGKVLQGVWVKDLRIRTKIVEALLDDQLYGYKIAKWYVEPKAKWDDEQAIKTGNGWKKKIELDIINPQYFRCDPDVDNPIDIPHKAKFISTERWVDKLWAADRWPEYKKYLVATGQWDDLNGVGTAAVGVTDRTGSNIVAPSGASREYTQTKGKNGRLDDYQSRLADSILGKSGGTIENTPNDTDQMVKIQEYYFKDYEMEDVGPEMEDVPLGEDEAEHLQRNPASQMIEDRNKPIFGEDGESTGFENFVGEMPKREKRKGYKRPKYPTGRLVIRIDEQIKVVDAPYESNNGWPFAVSWHYPLPHMWQGANAVELSRGYQDWMNVTTSHMTNYIKHYGDPKVLVEDGAIARSKDKKRTLGIPNWAGGVVRLARNAIGKIQILTPPAMPSALFNFYEMMKRGDQDLKGSQDVTSGRGSSGEQTLGELEILNRNSNQRIAMQGTFLDEWLVQIATGVVELMQKTLTIGDWVASMDPTQDAVMSSMQWTKEMADTRWDVNLEATSTLPYDEGREVAKLEQAVDKLGPAMFEPYLRKLNLDIDVDEVLSNHGILGPFSQMMEQANEAGIDPQAIMAAIQQQASLLAETAEGNNNAGQQQQQPPQ